jgi:hypothetical protein
VDEDGVEEDGVEGVYHVVIVVVAVTTTTLPPQEPEPEPEFVETGAAGVLGPGLELRLGLRLELGLEPEPGALYDGALGLADGVLWTRPGAAREEDTMIDGEETG